MANRSSRTRVIAYLLILLGGLGGLAVSAQAWWTVRHAQGEATLTGATSSAGLSQALPAALMAGWLLALYLPTRGKQVVSVVLLLLGLGMAVIGLIGAPPTEVLVESTVQQAALGGDSTLVRSYGGWLYAVCGVLVVVGAGWAAVRAPHWPSRGDRGTAGATSTRAAALSADDPAAIWKSLDEGRDPTVPDRSPGGQDPS